MNDYLVKNIPYRVVPDVAHQCFTVHRIVEIGNLPHEKPELSDAVNIFPGTVNFFRVKVSDSPFELPIQNSSELQAKLKFGDNLDGLIMSVEWNSLEFQLLM